MSFGIIIIIFFKFLWPAEINPVGTKTLEKEMKITNCNELAGIIIIIIIIIIKNKKIRVTLCENAAGTLYIVIVMRHRSN